MFVDKHSIGPNHWYACLSLVSVGDSMVPLALEAVTFEDVADDGGGVGAGGG